MSLTKETYENFYLGNGAENKISSEIFLHGFESHKFNPDIGVDLLVTNKALCQFKEAEEKSHLLQIKSTFLIDGKASFYIKEDELKYLEREEKIITVFCYFSPIIDTEYNSLKEADIDTESFLDDHNITFMKELYSKEFRKIKQEGCLSVIDFKGVEMNYIWFNNAQLKRAIKDGFIKYSHDGLHVLHLTNTTKSGLRIKGETGEVFPILEITNIYYFLKQNKSTERLNSGDFLLDHF